MSPSLQSKQPPRGSGTTQHWGMLLFESLSAGAMAILVGMGSVMIVVGLYVIFVWPLTSWDLADSGLEAYGNWANTVIWSIFAIGTLAGYWCFSGAAFNAKSKGKRSGGPAQPSKSTRR